MDELSIFHAALEIADPHARAVYLDWTCAGDTALRQRVSDLLEAHWKTTPFMSRPAAEVIGVARESDAAEVGLVIAGRYTLVERIGEGGMGEVWVAQQTEPVKRRVAVKLIKAGMDSNAVIARFEAERQALALMDHPNIARVFDGGVTDRGRPFFVMELVNALPLTRYCDEARLNPRQRLQLFVPVCQAVQHAHQKGIVHRDLKPSNVLVTLYDGRPVPKVIDFGVAKAIGGKLIENTPDTLFGAVVGTLEYMAPEQAGFSALDVDTRADIYSLGVILYELLTGLRPFDKMRLNSAAINEVLRIIREEDPPRPSTRLSTDDALPSLAAIRQTEPKRLTALMRGELDWVVMKCLEKDRTRRYETANALGRDIECFLADEVVEARPPSARYRLRKFSRKHRAALWTATAITILLVVGIMGTTWGMIQARRSEAHSRKLVTQLEKSNNIITSIFTDLDIEEVNNRDEPLQARLAHKLVEAAKLLDGEAVGDPQVVASLQHRLGESILSLGYPQEAIPVLAKAVETRRAGRGVDHDDTLASMNLLAEGYRAAGEIEQAEALHKETLRHREARLGAGHATTLQSKNNLALTYQADERMELAIPLFQEVLEQKKVTPGERHIDTLRSMNNLALALQIAGRPDEAIAIHEKTLNLRTEVLKEEHADTISSMSNLGEAYLQKGNKRQALDLLKKAYALAKQELGPKHVNTLTTMNALALAFQSNGQRELARSMFEDALAGMKARLGPAHPNTLRAMSNLAQCYEPGKEDFKRAVEMLEQAWGIANSRLRPDHSIRIRIGFNLALAYEAADDQPAKAVPILKDTVMHSKLKPGVENIDTIEQMYLLGRALLASGQPDEAYPYLRDAAVGMEKLKFQHPRAMQVVWTLVNHLEGLKKSGAAQEWRRKVWAFSNVAPISPSPPARVESGPMPREIKH